MLAEEVWWAFYAGAGVKGEHSCGREVMRLKISFFKENSHSVHLESGAVVRLVPRWFCSSHVCEDPLPTCRDYLQRDFLLSEVMTFSPTAFPD